MTLSSDRIELALTKVGERVHAAGEQASIVIVGGAALVLRAVIRRATSDVDVIAWQTDGRLEKPPRPLPEVLGRSVDAVGRELGLSGEWFDLRVATEWQLGLPAGFETRIDWRVYGLGLRVGLAGRRDLICFKLVAAADGQHGRHLQDLLHLAPNDEELHFALTEASRTNAGIESDLERVTARVRSARRA